MNLLLAFLTLASVASAAYLLTCLIDVDSSVDFSLHLFVLGTGVVILSGYAASQLQRFNQLSFWLLAALLILAPILLIVVFNRNLRKRCLSTRCLVGFTSWRSIFEEPQTTSFERWVVGLSVASLLILGLVNLWIIFRLVPFDWDSMEYHLARMAYYLQQGSLANYDPNYWAQVVHPKNSPILLAFLYLISGSNEHLTQLMQYGAYWAAVLGIYGLARLVRFRRIESLFSAAVFGLFIQCLMQATITLNDMLVTAYVGMVAYFLLHYGVKRRWTDLGMAGLSLGLLLGVKSSALLALPALGLLAGYSLLHYELRTSGYLKATMGLALGIALGMLLFTLPAGYLENYRLYGDPLGPQEVLTEHSFEGEGPGFILKNGIRNTFRYGVDFISLDGLKWPIFQQTQLFVRQGLGKIFERTGLHLESETGTRIAFRYDRLPSAHESFSYWGIMGFLLVWPLVFFSLFAPGSTWDRRILALGALLVFLAESFSGPYDPWRGRYFMTAGIFATPLVGTVFHFQRSTLLRSLLLLVVLLGCFSAFAAVFLRDNRSLLSYTYRQDDQAFPIESVLQSSRLEQFSGERAEFLPILEAYEARVPKTAVVALAAGRIYEYPLFGAGLTRRILPINSFQNGLKPIPQSAQYLLFSSDIIPPQDSDIFLGHDRLAGDLYLRTR